MKMTSLFYLLFFSGLCLWQYPALYSLYASGRSRLLARRNLKVYTQSEELQSAGRLRVYIRKLIRGANMERVFPDTGSFFFLSGVLGGVFFFLVAVILNPVMGILSGVFMGGLPAGILTALLHIKRVERSEEGSIMVSELLSNYKIYSYNIKEAVEVTVNTIENAPHARRVLLDLAKGLNFAVTKSELEEVLEHFRFSFHTVWADVLAVDIFFAEFYGIRVDYAIGDLLAGMVRSRKLAEHEKQENNEAKLMLKYLAPISYLLSFVCACKFFHYSLGKFLYYQFLTETGLQWFILIVIFFTGSVMLNIFISKGKMDL